MATRRAILERAGHKIELARNLLEVVSACERIDFDIVILGQALSAQEKLRVSNTVLEHCTDVKLLEYHNALVPDIATADAHLHVASSPPEALLETVKTLTGQG